MLTMKHVSYNFRSHWALKDISFEVEQGDLVLITGPSGAGKTTLMRILHGDLPVQRGEATIAGFDLRRLTASRLPLLRRNVSVVFQDFKILPHRSVAENVALPLEAKGMKPALIRKRVAAALRGLNLREKGDLKCKELSGGEQQRVAVARSIVVNPQVLLADEPTGNLDEDLSNRLLEVFKQFNLHGTTILLATHNRGFESHLPQAKTLQLKDGVLIDS
jgi:cell division transport system ATP-binding protein